MDLITVDFETFYSKEYSLRRMTTEAYIRDPRFQVIGMGIKVNDDPTEWLTSSGAIVDKLHSFDGKGAMLCHNTAFDGLIAREQFGFNPVFLLDTMSMARPKHALTTGVSLKALAEHYGLESKGNVLADTMGLRREQFNFMQLAALGAYCKTDVELTYKLFKILNKGFPPSELKLIDQTLRMYTDPVLALDRERLLDHAFDERNRKQDLLDTFGGDASVLMSNPKFAEVLISLGVSPPVKISKTTGKETWAFSKTDKGMLALLEHPDPAVRVAAEARLGVKSSIEETRATALAGVAGRGTLPIMLNYYGAHSGRFSGGDKLNLQNLPRGGILRQCILPPDDNSMLVAGDSSQIEARMLAYIAGQDDLVEAFRQGRDVYSEFASDVYGRTITKADKVERFLGKTCIAEGTLILTDRGEIPIEEIQLVDKVWDGVEWVTHEGLVFQGYKNVITYQGLTATEDHGVITDQGVLPFGIAASRLAALVTTFAGGKAVRIGQDSEYGITTPEAAHIRVRAMYDMWRGEVGAEGEFISRNNSGLSVLLANKIAALKGAGQEIRRYILALQPLLGPQLQALREAWDTVQVQVADGIYPVGSQAFTPSYILACGDRPQKQQRPLQAGELTACHAAGASSEPAQHGAHTMVWEVSPAEQISFPVLSRMDIQVSCEGRANWGRNRRTVRVFDLANAGPRRRYTAAGKLVFNCILGLGYGMGHVRFREALALGMGGMKVAIEEHEARRIVGLYRDKNFKIASLWNEAGTMLRSMANGETGTFSALQLPFDSEHITFPNGLGLTYPNLRMDQNNFVYDSRKLPVKLFGAKAVENVVQGLARIVVTDQMLEVGKRYRVVMQVHDEIVVVASTTSHPHALRYIKEVMSTPPAWAPDLPVACEVACGGNYGECK